MYNIHLLGAKLLIRYYLLFLNGGLRDRIPSFIVTFLVLLVVADAFRSFHCDSDTNFNRQSFNRVITLSNRLSIL